MRVLIEERGTLQEEEVVVGVVGEWEEGARVVKGQCVIEHAVLKYYS